MTITFLTIFPDYFTSPLQQSILKRAQEKSLVRFELLNIREFALDKHQMTDDRPFGGGAGMVMKVEPIDRAIESWRKQHHPDKTWLVATSASGKQFSQVKAQEFSTIEHLGILCGHYEGIDQRVLEHLVDEVVRIGDYVLTGGEPAALVMADAVTRLLPGALGNEASTTGEAHEHAGQGTVPQYTRPSVYKGWSVPQVLLEGDHAAIDRWREANRQRLID